ncbi:probable pectinesterase/pectinesterase inhibitor 46 [Olea europaea var. sylvestris]|uniref:probable pectinesterase/pectinesterase inhibitor 46 n=1 Tax=Olea europaea var. sylvestris TaxID=158386 RepID=UPI000C1D5DF0|nr:probable pectinesterase/pectinesterase inhibitor 46 [Olea europaea var. sylvestris]
MASVNPYGKLNEAEQERLVARRNTRRRITIIGLSSIVLVAVIVATVVGVTQSKNGKSEDKNKSMSSAIKGLCNVTLYPDSCYNSLSPMVKSGNFKPEYIYKLAVQVAIDELSKASNDFLDNGNKKFNLTDQMTLAALESCQELISLALDHLNDSLSIEDMKLFEAFEDLRTWLSSAGTYQQTCIDGLENGSNGLHSILVQNLKNSTEYTSNSLAIISSIEDSIDSLGAIGRRRLMSFNADEAPNWLSFKDRKLLQAPSSKIKADAVVTKDGSGKYKTISAALKAVPEKSKKRFIIYVKRGVYFENVRVEKKKWNVMIIGDGKDATIVSGNLNFVDGTPTFQSATFAVFGQGFIARDMGFRNTAGAAKHQAVALMSTADLSVFYRCNMDAFQDTLYPHSNRQFYRECNIYGTVDFIFGNAAVVIQNSNILPQKPMPGQQNTITAQGKIDPNQNTGISIQNCTILPSGNLNGVNTFLGRPWKNYSTTVYMQSMMGSFIDPKGWLPWVGTSAPNTIFYAEFQNFGPGAVTKNRVKWRGLKLNLITSQAKKFTVNSFIDGHKWLPATGVSFKSGL